MILSPIRNRIQYCIESIFLSGTLGRLFIAALLITGFSFLAGLVGYTLALDSQQAFDSPFDAIWWAFLRLSDPGYLGDDEGVALRIVATLITISGYVLFVGVLVAILTQGLNERIRRLERGTTPISARKHVILLGWSPLTPLMVEIFMRSDTRVERFLERVGARRLKLVLLINEVNASHWLELRTYLGHARRIRGLILRSGSPLRLDHLNRVDYLNASSIVLPAQERGSREAITRSDDAAIKTLLSIAHSVRLSSQKPTPPPLLVAELFDARKAPIALSSYDGPLEIVASDQLISRMFAQMTRHPHISAVYRELLSLGQGNEVFIRELTADQIGVLFWDLARRQPKAVLIGVTQTVNDSIIPLLNPPEDYQLQAHDRLVFIATAFGALNTDASPDAHPGWPAPRKTLERLHRTDHHVLILGWSRRIPALLQEYEHYENQNFVVTIATRTAPAARELAIRDYGPPLTRTQVTQIQTDYTLPERLEALQPATFDTLLCLASDSSETFENADARTLVACNIIRRAIMATPQNRKPRLLVEILDELNLGLINGEGGEYLLSPHIIGYMLTEVALRRELNAVFQELFNSSETEILLRDFERYGLEVGTRLTFDRLQQSAREHSEIALGIFKASHPDANHEGNNLNPDRDAEWTLEPGDQIIVLHS